MEKSSLFYEEKEFKDPEIGRIPKEWKVVDLGEICAFESGKRPKGGAKEKGDILSIGGEHIDDSGYLNLSSPKFVSKAFYNLLQKGILQIGNIIMCKDGAKTGKVAYVRELKSPAAVNEHVFIIRSKKSEVLNQFIFYCLFSFIGQSQIKAFFHGIIGGIISKDLSILKIALPPLEEQMQIANILNSVDSAIEKTDEVIAKTERLKKGMMQELLTKGIGHKEFKDSEIGKIPREWKALTLDQLVEVYDSRRIPLSEMERNKRKGVYPYCGANGIIDFVDDYLFEGEHVLLAEDGGDYDSFGRSAYIMNGRFWVNNHAHVLRAIPDRTSNTFLLYSLNYLNLNPCIVGSTRKKLNQDAMKRIIIPTPPLSEQQQIASILSVIDRKLELERNEKSRLERIKKGFMNKLLTGKIRVRVEN